MAPLEGTPHVQVGASLSIVSTFEYYTNSGIFWKKHDNLIGPLPLFPKSTMLYIKIPFLEWNIKIPKLIRKLTIKNKKFAFIHIRNIKLNI